MTVTRENLFAFYAGPGPMTGLGEYADLVQDLPADLPGLIKVVQGLAVHIFWAERYGLQLSEERKAEVNLRPVQPKLKRLLELDPSPLDCPRELDKKLVCNCRDFSTLLTAFLRAKGIPARARCGFGTYFMPGHFEDHWVVEAWLADRQRWVMADPQLDELQMDVLKPPFDPLDMPPGQFVLAGAAWQMCTAGQANPDDFGIFEWHGWDFIRGNVQRDIASMAKVETLPWDFWGVMAEKSSQDYSPAERATLEEAAALSASSSLDALRFYEEHPEYQVPQGWQQGV